jgi:predicted acyltransferase (DUF342 family)
MAVTDATKVDLLLKKLSGVAKTDTAANKSVSNESIASPTLNRGDSLWLNAYLVPATANATIGTVTGYLQNNRVECTADTTSQRMSGSVYPTWKTGLTDWIPPEFDTVNVTNSYRVKVYYGASGLTDPSNSGGTQIFADGILGTGEWYFDYQAGILHFYGNSIPTGMTGSHVIYVFGYRYVGPKGFDYAFKIDSSIMRQDATGIVGLPTLITLKGDAVVAENLTVTKDLEIQGGDLTTNQNVFNLLNTYAQTINFAGAATLVEIGAPTGKTNINHDLEVDGDVTIDGGDLKVTTTTFNLIPDTAETVNFAGAATNLIVGATSGTTNVRNNLDVDGNLTVNSNLDVDGDLNIDGGDLTVSQPIFNLANTMATTVNFAGAATTIEIGATTGTTNVNNNLEVNLDMNVGQNLDVDANVHVGQNLDVDGDVNIDGGDLTVSTTEFNLANTTAKTVNFAGEATNIEIGSSEGVTNVNNNLSVDGNLQINRDLAIAGNFAVDNNLYVEASARVSQSLEVEDSVKVQRELEVEGDTNISKDLNVKGYIKGGKLIDTTIDCGEY